MFSKLESHIAGFIERQGRDDIRAERVFARTLLAKLKTCREEPGNELELELDKAALSKVMRILFDRRPGVARRFFDAVLMGGRLAIVGWESFEQTGKKDERSVSAQLHSHVEKSGGIEKMWQLVNKLAEIPPENQETFLDKTLVSDAAASQLMSMALCGYSIIDSIAP